MQIDVIVSLLSGRLVRERIGPAMLSAVQSQVGGYIYTPLCVCVCDYQAFILECHMNQFLLLTKVSYVSQMGAVEVPFEEVPNIFDIGGAKGLLVDTVERIPKFTITRDDSFCTKGDRVSCSVCLQVALQFLSLFF